MRKDWNRKEIHDILPLNKRRILLCVSYNGSGFSGFQKQSNALSVATCIEEAIKKITGEIVIISPSGRTDSGVHAIGQYCHFDTSSIIPSERFAAAINANISGQIKVMSSTEVSGTFHARFSALAREYRYFLKEYRHCTVFDEGRVWQMKELPDISTLNALSSIIKGETDFRAFAVNEDKNKSTMRDVYVSEFYKDGDTLVYKIIANAFLYHQIRSLVGTFIKIAQKTTCKDEAVCVLKKIMNGESACIGIYTAPPWGLYFYNTIYSEDEWKVLSKDIEKGNTIEQ